MGGAVALLLGLALGQERALVLVEGPAAHDDDAEARVLEAMVGSPYEQIAVVPGDHIDELVRVVGVEVLDPSCDGPVSLGSWNTRLELARQQAQLLDVRSSLATLSMLDLELSCLDSALQVRVAEEFFVELGRTHVLAAEMDPRPDARPPPEPPPGTREEGQAGPPRPRRCAAGSGRTRSAAAAPRVSRGGPARPPPRR